MRVFLCRLFPLLLVIAGIAFVRSQSAAGGQSVVRGWLSDESCAGGRASSGTYTGANPDCAKKCVPQGKKIVLVDPDHKRLPTIANQDAARERWATTWKSRVTWTNRPGRCAFDSMKLLEKGRASQEE